MNYGLHSYAVGLKIAQKDYPFYALIQAAIRKADTDNLLKLSSMWPELYDELKERYNAPGGIIPADDIAPERIVEVIKKVRDIEI